MRSIFIFIFISCSIQVKASPLQCSQVFAGLSGLPFSERETLIIDAYIHLWNDLGGDINPEQVEKFLASGDPLKIPRDVVLESESFRSSLETLSEIVNSGADPTDMKAKLLNALAARTQKTFDVEEKQVETVKSDQPRIKWGTTLVGFTSSWDANLMGGYGDILPPNGNFILFDREKQSFQRLPWLEKAQKRSATLSNSGRFILVHESNPMELAKYLVQEGKIQEPYKERLSIRENGGQSLREIKMTPDDLWAFATTNFTQQIARYNLTTGEGEWLLSRKQVYSWMIGHHSGKVSVLVKNGKKMEIYFEKPEGNFSKPLYTHDTILEPADGFGVSGDGSKVYITERDAYKKNPQLLEIPVVEQTLKERFLSLVSLKPRAAGKKIINFRFPGEEEKELLLKKIMVAPSGAIYLHVHFENEQRDSVRKIEFSDGSSLVQEIYDGKDSGELNLSFTKNALLLHSPQTGTLAFQNP